MIYNEMITDDQFEEFMVIYGDRIFGKQKSKGDYEMSDKPCGYTLAGVDTFATLMDRFIRDYPGYITPDNMRDFISKSVDKYLFSYGTGLNYKTKKIADNYSEKMLKSIHKFNKIDFMDKAKIVLDSGGFQVSMGAVYLHDVPKFIDMYYSFIEEHHEEFSHAFLLDIPPGPGLNEFQASSDDLYKLNKLSYERALQVPDHIRKEKMIYIHHFRTPRVYDTWSKLLLEDDLGLGYTYYATGGLVAFGSSDVTIPAILYCIPLSTIISYCKKQGLKAFKFHVLGGANIIDVLYHKLFSKHIKEFHDIDCTITYDSSSIFKGAFNGRYLNVLKEDNVLMKMSFKSNELHLRFDNEHTVEEKMFKILNKVAELYNLKLLSNKNEPIYDNTTGTLSKPISNYIMLAVLQLYKDVEDISEEIVNRLYEVYENSTPDNFNKIAVEVTRLFNQGKMTRKQKSKAFSIYNSLKLLENLDEEYNEYIINKYMAGGDSSKMESGGCLTF